jgi:proteasome lid subunit RPN8/RPN11
VAPLIRVRPTAIDAIVDHARAEAPLECCGLLIGSDDLVEESYRVTNLLKSEVAYRVDPAGHFAAIRKARASGRAVIGAYHSHPRSPAVPSETDIGEANDPALLHVIVSLAGDEPVVRAYRITAGGVFAVPIADR